MKRLRHAVWFASFVLVAVVAFAWFTSERKQYRGRTLGQWLQPTVPDSQSREAISHFLTNAALAIEEAGRPGAALLLSEAAATDNSWNWRMFAACDHLYQRGWLIGTRPRFLQWPQARVFWAASILSSLRVSPELIPLVAEHFSAAESALVALGTRAPSVRVSNPVARGTLELRFHATATALVNGGPTGIAIVTNALARITNRNHRIALVYVLQNAGTNAEPAVPALLALTSRPADPERIQRQAHGPVPPGIHTGDWSDDHHLVLRALMDIRGPAAAPFLVRAATNGHADALSALAEYGPAAQAYLPQLLPLTTNADPQVSFQAEIAVRKIQGR